MTIAFVDSFQTRGQKLYFHLFNTLLHLHSKCLLLNESSSGIIIILYFIKHRCTFIRQKYTFDRILTIAMIILLHRS